MKKRKAKPMKKYSGQPYTLHGFYLTKTKAMESAKRLRSKRNKTRLQESTLKGTYFLWWRKR